METSVVTRTNQQIIEQSFADFADGNIAAILDICAEDISWAGFRIPGLQLTYPCFGKEGVQDYFTQLADQIDYAAVETKQFISQGDYVIVLGEESGTVKSTGKLFRQQWAMYFRMENGKVKEAFQYYDSYAFAQAYNMA